MAIQKTIGTVIDAIDRCYTGGKKGAEKCDGCPYKEIGKRRECYVEVVKDAQIILKSVQAWAEGDNEEGSV